MTTGDVPAIDKAFQRVDDGIATVKAELPAVLDKLAVLGEISERARAAEPHHLAAVATGRETRHSMLDFAVRTGELTRDWDEHRWWLLEAGAVIVNWILDGDRREVDSRPGPWEVHMVCCGYPAGIQTLATRRDAEAFRDSWLDAEGHQRGARLSPAAVDQQPGWRRNER